MIGRCFYGPEKLVLEVLPKVNAVLDSDKSEIRLKMMEAEKDEKTGEIGEKFITMTVMSTSEAEIKVLEKITNCMGGWDIAKTPGRAAKGQNKK